MGCLPLGLEFAAPYIVRLPAIASALLIACTSASRAEEPQPSPCNEDAMIVFDASGSMAGNVGQGSGIPRIDEARHALAEVLPSATKFRRVGLITFGPGPYQQCNVHLDLKPTANAAEPIMRAVNALTPAGRTPLVSAVQQGRRRTRLPKQAWPHRSCDRRRRDLRRVALRPWQGSPCRCQAADHPRRRLSS
jgi:hypothetical protein